METAFFSRTLQDHIAFLVRERREEARAMARKCRQLRQLLHVVVSLSQTEVDDTFPP